MVKLAARFIYLFYLRFQRVVVSSALLLHNVCQKRCTKASTAPCGPHLLLHTGLVALHCLSENNIQPGFNQL